MGTVVAAILKTLLTRLVTEKVLIGVFLHIAASLVAKTSNTLDDKLFKEIKDALE